MLRPSAFLLLLITTAWLPATLSAGEPTVDAAQQELHGTFAGQQFWARLALPDKQFGNNRVLQLVYTPPSETELAGAHVSDCPFLLLDPTLRLVAWNGRDTGSKAVPAAPNGYRITREVTVVDGQDKRIDLDTRAITGERGWELRSAPILLALAWHSGTSSTVRLVDLFGPRHAEALLLTWNDTSVVIAGTAFTAVADDSGHLKNLNAADGSTVLTVTGRP
jgi:hypothetical protein